MEKDLALYARRADFGARILIVDDDAITRRGLRAQLERAHYLVESAEGGQRALEILPAWRPDLVLLDILMPGMDGLETCRRMRATPGGELLPIIFLTADGRPETHVEAFRAKGDDFLRKPVLETELVVRIRSLMRLKRLQAEIHAERDALIDSQKQRERLFEFIVHDLKNPLATIQAGLDLLGGREDNPAAAQAQVQRIRENVLSMGRMIQDILDIGRAEQMGLDVHRSRIRLTQWLPQLLQEVEYRVQRLNLTVSWICPEDLAVDADRELLRRMMLNLLDNAIKYSPKSGKIRIEAAPGERCVVLRVRDEGPGIAPTMREVIFQKFARLEDGGAESRAGSGLGLTFCQAAAEAHGGCVRVESNEPSGSVFIIEVPCFEEPGVGV